MEQDNRGQKTILSGMVKEFFNQPDAAQILSYVYSSTFQKSEIAKLARLVQSAASQGDTIAQAIEATAANDLIALASTLIHRAQLFAHTIVLSGGIILHNKSIRSTFEAAIIKAFPNMQIMPMEESAELGAAHIASLYSQ